LFQDSTQDPLGILLDNLSGIGLGDEVTEKFLVTPKVILLDANQEQKLFETTLIIESLDPRTTVQPEPEFVVAEKVVRKFIDDDFSEQLTDNGKNFHAWTGWERFIQGNNPSPSWQFTRTCGTIPDHNNGCIRMFIKRDCEDTTTL